MLLVKTTDILVYTPAKNKFHSQIPLVCNCLFMNNSPVQVSGNALALTVYKRLINNFSQN
jgi:hypothetical protein